jgi:hypothetical protein
MIWRIKTYVCIIIASVMVTPLAFAHGKGPNGGQYVHIGTMHTEFLQNGQEAEREWRFLVSDNDEKSADTEGGTAQITILDKGESRLITASPSGKNSFVARIEGSVSQGAKLVITGTLKDKRTFVGRFEVK